MDKSEEKIMKKMRPTKNNWYDWLINYIPQPIGKNLCSFKDKFIGLFKANTPKQYMKQIQKQKTLNKPKTQNKIRIPFILKKNKNKIE